MNKIELLAPAANLASGKLAIDAGADAVYIGGPAFGAREKAGNSIEHIAALAQYAHQFGARVYLTMNTILYDTELSQAQELVHQAWQAGVDALIVQDMALLEMNLPPIPLHASTQTFNLTVERAQFLEQAGFERVILERGITLAEIEAIRSQTKVELEAFVHGAICVGYSGQCYLSQSLCSRSGNRGACAQPCRSLWTLVEGESGRILSQDQALLSVGDLNLSDNLGEMIAAGVCSLKIEGRLKDEAYVVNNVAHYNRKLTELGVPRTSHGVSTPAFEPNPLKSFSRNFSTFVTLDRNPKGSLLNSSRGEYLGRVTVVGADYFEIDTPVKINNGDGITFASEGANATGTNINTTSGHKIFPNRIEGIKLGLPIYRNLDRAFNPQAIRRIDVSILFDHEHITAQDAHGVEVQIAYSATEQAINSDKAAENIKNALSKSGGTIFRVSSVEVRSTPFLPISQLNELRRELLEKLLAERINSFERSPRIGQTAYPQSLSGRALDYRANVSNHLAREFYAKCGVETISQAFELEQPREAILLRTRHCIRRELGICLRIKGAPTKELYIENNGRRLALAFDCAACEMMIRKA